MALGSLSMDDLRDPEEALSTQQRMLKAAIAVPSTVGETIVQGVSIRYRLWGDAAQGGRPLVLVHGMLAHTRWWDAIAGMMVEDRPVVALDLSGLGDSDWRTVYSRDLHAEEIASVAGAVGFEGPLLVAHSYGGDPATRACLADPVRFRSLVLLDSRLPLPESTAFVPPNMPSTLVRKSYPSFEAALTRFRLAPDSRLANSAVLEHVACHSIRQEGDSWSWKFDPAVAEMAARDHPLNTRSLRVPTVFVRGAESEVVSPYQMALTQRYLPDARMLTVPGAGHHILLDQPFALVAMLRGLFSDK